jgi:hypothetical protein
LKGEKWASSSFISTEGGYIGIKLEYDTGSPKSSAAIVDTDLVPEKCCGGVVEQFHLHSPHNHHHAHAYSAQKIHA